MKFLGMNTPLSAKAIAALTALAFGAAIGGYLIVNSLREPAPESGAPQEEKAEEKAPTALTTVTVYPATRAWTSVAIGASSTQEATITNTGKEPFIMTKFADEGGADLTQTNDCPAIGVALEPGKSCTIIVTFAPKTTGEQTKVFSFYGNVEGGRVFLVTRGTGTNPEGLDLSPGSLTFPDEVTVGRSSAPMTVTVTNKASGPLNITNISTSADFSQKHNCPATIASKATCTITVTFVPTAVGLRHGTLTVKDSGIGSPHSIPLLGEGKAAGTPLVLLAATIEFGSVTIGESRTNSWKMTNTGGGNLTIKSITRSGSTDFSETHTCGVTLAADASCTFTVIFKPTSAGSKTGSVTIEHNAGVGKTVLFLTGTGVEVLVPKPSVSLAPTSLAFGIQRVGTTSSPKSITLTNTGSASLSVSSITAAGDFDETHTCGITLAAGASCYISVTFVPSVEGIRTGSVTIVDDASGSPHVVPLSGTGENPPSPQRGQLQLNSTTYVVGEADGSVVITVTRTDGSDGIVGIYFSTSNGTALSAQDFTLVSGTLTFNSGETVKTFTVPIIDDAIPEGEETFTVHLSSPTGGATLGVNTAEVRITDNDIHQQ
jgi:Calx-beta domain-containing protein/ASPM-SPD-2-Hydin domain-containing protein/centrosomal CEP192-like protein/HYDIN/CFA65/VesB family protein